MCNRVNPPLPRPRAKANGRRGPVTSSSGFGLVILLVVLFGLIPGNTVWALPAQVILLRHAEKPAEHDDVHLNERGRERAQALADWLRTDPTLTRHGTPTVLYATRISRRDHSRRPYETLQPLARQLKLPIETPYAAEDYRALAKRVLTDPECDGKTVVICWVHEYLPALASAFGIEPEPSAWKAHVFDRAWLIRWSKHGPKLVDVPQHLLPEDSKR